MKKLLLAASASAYLVSFASAPAFAQEAVASAVGVKVSISPEDTAKLKTVLADPRRDKDRARDQYRHPLETLSFFGVTPNMTVAEYAPGGGGWYTEILASYLADKGQYVGVNFAPDTLPFPEESKAPLRKWAEEYPAKVATMTGLPAAKFKAVSTDKIPDDMAGTVDFVLLPRMMHNLYRWNVADNEVKALRKLLKPDGLMGVVQHRAKDDAAYSYADGNKGYLRTKTVVDFIQSMGFELVAESEINANPKDTADYEGGVWTLPPTYGKKDVDKAKYTAIGESDRMTLLFRKLP